MRKAGIFLLVSIIIITVVLRVDYLTSPVNQNDKQKIIVEIKEGSSSRDIGKRLYSKNLIRSLTIFNLLVSLRNYDSHLQAGYYSFSRADSLTEIVDKLVKGRVATIEITIPEGYDVKRICERLAARTPYSYREFLNIMKEGEFNKSYLPAKEINYRYRLEGFLYPDTYIIPYSYSPREMVNFILSEFEERWLPILKDKKVDEKYAIYKLMTVASLVEREARLNKEKPLIAAVIFNRLQRNMLLQIDACIQYSLQEQKKRIFYSDLKVESPYNTYRYSGLPPGPICSPGDKSILAALNPADVNYLFYFARKDGSHVFSHTYQEHLDLQAEIREEK